MRTLAVFKLESAIPTNSTRPRQSSLTPQTILIFHMGRTGLPTCPPRLKSFHPSKFHSAIILNSPSHLLSWHETHRLDIIPVRINLSTHKSDVPSQNIPPSPLKPIKIPLNSLKHPFLPDFLQIPLPIRKFLGYHIERSFLYDQ